MNPDQPTPTMMDISNLLASVGKPGKKQEEKIEAVKQLFKDTNSSGVNIQGHAVWESLESYPEF